MADKTKKMQLGAAILSLKKISPKEAVKYLIFFALFCCFALAKLTDNLTPFSFGFFLALVFTGHNVLLLTPMYVGANLLISPTVDTLISSACTTATLLIICVINLKMKRRISLPMLSVYAVIGQAGYIYLCIQSSVEPLNAILTLVFGLAFMYISVIALSVLSARKMRFVLNKSEVACLAIVLAAVSSGIYSIPLAGVFILRGLLAFIVLAACCSMGAAFAMGTALSVGMGAALAGGDPSIIAGFACMAFICCLFSDLSKYLCAAAMVIMDIVFGYYFSANADISLWLILPVAVGGLLYCVLPLSFTEALRDFLCGTNEKVASRFIVNRTKDQLSRRMSELSDVFMQMERIFGSMAKGGMSNEDARLLLANEMPVRLCDGCNMRERCYSECAPQTMEAFCSVIYIALERGKANIMDVPSYLSSRCSRLTSLVSLANQMAAAAKGRNAFVANMDVSRILIGEQLGGVSRLFDALSVETKQGANFDFERERVLIDELTYINALCIESVITMDGSVYTVNLILKNGSYQPEKIQAVVAKVLKCRLVIISDEPSKKAGYSVVTLRSAPAFDLALGISGVAKNGEKQSGDSHGFTRIGDDRIMFALCDGMGAGERAEKLSSSALSLIENFYKAGFDNATILSSVNKLLSIGSDEAFTTLDICIVSLREGSADFIKIGAPYGLIKRSGNTDVIDAASLPLGVLDDIRPQITRRMLAPNDVVVLATDGVCDVFNSSDDFIDAVNTYDTMNPQSLANKIVDHCVEADRFCPHDDMTVLCARLYKQV